MDLRRSIIEDIDLSASKIEFNTKAIVLLCGGYVPENSYQTGNSVSYSSIRHQLSDVYTDFEQFRPEEITNWQTDGIFKNLMDFEIDLAGICSLVIIILESAGAIAELGAFSQLDDLKNKLVVFISDIHANENSFINLGLLRSISRDHQSSVRSHRWNLSPPTSVSEEVLQDIIEDINDELSSSKKTQTLKISNNAHLITVIHELIKLCIALKESEIIDALTTLGSTIAKDELQRKLFLMERFQLIKIVRQSDSFFYVAYKQEFHAAKFSLKTLGPYHHTRFKLDLLKYYKETKSERNRTRAITKANIGGQ